MDVEIKQEVHDFSSNHLNESEKILKGMHCPLHHQGYVYYCENEHCGQFLCGKMACIDNHFHDNHLTIYKIDKVQLNSDLNVLGTIDERVHLMDSQLKNIKEKVDFLKEGNKSMFLNIKNFRETSEFLNSSDSYLN
jgi:hypothetical protein